MCGKHGRQLHLSHPSSLCAPACFQWVSSTDLAQWCLWLFICSLKSCLCLCVVIWKCGTDWESLREAQSWQKEWVRNFRGGAHVCRLFGVSTVGEFFFSFSFLFLFLCLSQLPVTANPSLSSSQGGVNPFCTGAQHTVRLGWNRVRNPQLWLQNNPDTNTNIW